jgi:AAA+ superfamily predicted ATPase
MSHTFKVGDWVRFKDGLTADEVNQAGWWWPGAFSDKAPTDFAFKITEVNIGEVLASVYTGQMKRASITAWHLHDSALEKYMQLFTKKEDEVPMKVTFVRVSSVQDLQAGAIVRVSPDASGLIPDQFAGEAEFIGLHDSGYMLLKRLDGEGGAGPDGSWFFLQGQADKLEQKENVSKDELDVTQMDKFIMTEQNRKEIIAVLKQHKHAKKLFEDWGLGEVIEYGKGMTYLFYGPPGTGKTWAAHCIAKTIGRELLIISAAEIQSSEPGGANRAIQQAFAEAKSKKKVLFIDECDSLVQSRTNLGMVLGSEVNTLLTEIEKFEGIAILATNMVENLDEALERRISLMVEFPKPKRAERRLIWDRMLPKKMPLGKDVDKEELSKPKLTGGQIKNVILNAARLAIAEESEVVAKAHFDAAIARLLGTAGLMGNDNWTQDSREDTVGGKSVDRSKVKTRTDDIEIEKTSGEIASEEELSSLLG